jgi:two-component system chemotaxis response regulator CheB
MVSSLTNEGAEATLKALDLGAVDFIPKQLSKVSLDIVKIEANLISKVKIVASRRMMHSRPRLSAPVARAPVSTSSAAPYAAPGRPAAAPTLPSGPVKRDVVAIGVSTGGPPAVQKILSALPADFPASIVIAQHMPQAFTGPFAKRLDGLCKISVKEAEPGDRLKPGCAFIAPGGRHLMLKQLMSRVDLDITPEPASALYKPSANVLIGSVADAVGRRALGVILTGMGNDGMEGIRALKQKGGRALAQSDATCVVYGMPKAIVDAGLSDEIVDIDDMAQAIMNNLYL